MIRRFYRQVAVQRADSGWQITLDGRGLKTVKGAAQVVPTQALAEALAEEWVRQGDPIDPQGFALRDMADYAIDIVTPAPQVIAQQLIAYAETDTLCYRADPDEPLYARQCEVWEPVLTAFEARTGLQFIRVSGIVHRPQDEATLAALKARLLRESPFVLAGLEGMTALSASLVAALCALECESEADWRQLWQAASLEEEWQAALWGRDHEADERRARREAAFLQACQFARLARN